MKRNRTFVVAVIVIIFLLAAGAWWFGRIPENSPPAREPIVIGTSPFEVSGLIFIAYDQGYFEENCLLPQIKMYDAGAIAMDALYRGDVDIATAADTVFAWNSISGFPIQGVASIGKSEFHYIIARQDRGIRNISDLRGKKIGVARGTSGDFFLGRFLALQRINLSDVEIIDLPPAQLTEPLLNGSVDAVSTWDPYAFAIEERLGNNAQVWPDQKGQMMYWIAICRKDYVLENPLKIHNFLQALQQAEKYVENHPDAAKLIVQKKLHTENTYMNRVWPFTQLSLSLDQSLVLAMEDEARWMIANNLTNKTSVPDFREYLYIDGLEAVKPGSVNIIR